MLMDSILSTTDMKKQRNTGIGGLQMSLIEDLKEPCVLIEKSRVPDGEGGFITAWRDGAEFMAAISIVSSTQAVIAERQGMSRIYTVTTDKNAMLEFHDIFRRVEDGQVFRVTSNGKDVQTPKNSAITAFSQVTAEEFILPVG